VAVLAFGWTFLTNGYSIVFCPPPCPVAAPLADVAHLGSLASGLAAMVGAGSGLPGACRLARRRWYWLRLSPWPTRPRCDDAGVRYRLKHGWSAETCRLAALKP
jgi:hypothetical protein